MIVRGTEPAFHVLIQSINIHRHRSTGAISIMAPPYRMRMSQLSSDVSSRREVQPAPVASGESTSSESKDNSRMLPESQTLKDTAAMNQQSIWLQRQVAAAATAAAAASTTATRTSSSIANDSKSGQQQSARIAEPVGVMQNFPMQMIPNSLLAISQQPATVAQQQQQQRIREMQIQQLQRQYNMFMQQCQQQQQQQQSQQKSMNQASSPTSPVNTSVHPLPAPFSKKRQRKQNTSKTATVQTKGKRKAKKSKHAAVHLFMGQNGSVVSDPATMTPSFFVGKNLRSGKWTNVRQKNEKLLALCC